MGLNMENVYGTQNVYLPAQAIIILSIFKSFARKSNSHLKCNLPIPFQRVILCGSPCMGKLYLWVIIAAVIRHEYSKPHRFEPGGIHVALAIVY